ncbi:FUSC family protein [Oleiagrimonas soli]|uniref:Putative membrane protein YccC n=1 Tax=Oleiagrimonas soli TaxID=1543381 RepID=A0A099CWN8_9GAMM|nr:FUSC family protein [Oleiagrimonas soli]KGI78032.1 hypothetical protein LF63_0106550 [Oleiagrimonas soli]MBB6183575.1 putative membrane protein YccC [Oleiagrimonas soli]
MSPAYSLRASLLHTLTHFKRPDVPVRVALRAALLVAGPLAVGVASGHAAIGLGLGAGAFNVIFSDQPGPYRQRLTRIVLASLAAGLAALAGFLLGAHLPSLLAAVAVCGFLGGLLVVFGADMARVGMISMILLVIAAASPLPWSQAWPASALIAAGGLLLAVVSVAAWPLQRYRPERQALAAIFRELAPLAAQRESDEEAPALSDAINRLQQMLLGQHPVRGRAVEALRVLAELAERMRLELLAIDQLRRNAPAVDEALPVAVHATLTQLADALEHAQEPDGAERAAQTLRARIDDLDAASPLRPRLLALHGQLTAAVRNARWAGSRGEIRALRSEAHLPRVLRGVSPWATLRANLTLHSAAFRHALRCAVCLALAQWLERTLGLPRGYWLPMTAAIVLRPDFAATFSFGMLRIVGTVLGLVLTSLLLMSVPDAVWAHVLLLGVLVFAFRYLATAHYGLAVAALTGAVVILLSFEGSNPDVAVLDRLLNTSLGCGLALTAYLVWPTWERGRARNALAEMLRAYADYLAALTLRGTRRQRDNARAAARLARSNAQASLERLRAEPGVPSALRRGGDSLFANGNRLARTAMTLEAVLMDCEAHPARAAFDDYLTHIAATVRALSEACDTQRSVALPDLRAQQQALAARLGASADPADASLIALSDRLADNVDTLHHVLEREMQPSATA